MCFLKKLNKFGNLFYEEEQINLMLYQIGPRLFALDLTGISY